MIGAVLTDAVRGTWIERLNKSVSIPDEPSALPLSVKRRADGVAADLFFPPYRDDSRRDDDFAIDRGGRPGFDCSICRGELRPALEGTETGGEPESRPSRATTCRLWSKSTGRSS